MRTPLLKSFQSFVEEEGFLKKENEPLFRNHPASKLGLQDIQNIRLIPRIIEIIKKFPLIKGEKGDRGERGMQGISGVRGIMGLQGRQGIQGERGWIGIQGEKGDKGETGEKGEMGEKPIPGIDFPIPKNGKNGKDGKDGREASVEELQELARKEMNDHTTKFNHEFLHDPKILGTKKVNESSLVHDGVLTYNKRTDELVFKKIVIPTGEMHGGGMSRRYKIKNITSSSTIDHLDDVIHADATNGDITLTIFSAVGKDGSHHFIKRIDNSPDNDVTFEMTNSETIDFETLYMLVNRGSGAEIYNDGSNWFIKHIS